MNIEDILAISNRRRAEVEELRAENERLREKCRLAAEVQIRTGTLADQYEAESERLQALLVRLQALFEPIQNERDDLRSEVITLEWQLSEATKEIERLQAQVAAHHTHGFICQS